VQEGSRTVNGSPQENARRLDGDLAWIWLIISSLEDCDQVAKFFARIIKRESKIPVAAFFIKGGGI
jgi:hypothetical protein